MRKINKYYEGGFLKSQTYEQWRATNKNPNLSDFSIADNINFQNNSNKFASKVDSTAGLITSALNTSGKNSSWLDFGINTGAKVLKAGDAALKAKNLGAGFKALGGIGGVAGIGLAAASALPIARESDIQDTTGDVLKYGSMAAGLLLGVTNPIGLGIAGLAVANNAFGKTAKKAGVGANALSDYGVAGAYGTLTQDIARQGKKSSWTANHLGPSYNKTSFINKQVADLTNKRARALDIGYNNKIQEQLASSAIYDIIGRDRQQLYGGVDTSVLAAKFGAKLDSIENVRNILKNKKGTKIISTFDDSISKFENGGKVNVIPDGALHKELNHLNLDTTKKGIPVVTMAEGGEIDDQQAEIERNEIILHLSLTKKLESLLKKYEENEDDKFAIEAGKLLATEILENTEDNTGLIDTIE